ncbi:GntR family transcriptional regulator [Devosia neptuniae]|uniref:GntR family transcriptional regulator n=1 Tax=Devosia neptuniae TaxID=191302 RepID=UPI0022AFA1B3|nr:GntR family transcriptional regulator [Devosia neptuniae]MCZ4348149.1 GntR family transcriptional regulator [Devosia neptuniae]
MPTSDKPSSLLSDLENDIIFGVYSPGTRITEDSVMDHYGAKRHVVRHVFSELENQGLLVHRPRRGVEVVDFTPDEVDDLYDLRVLMESAAARRTLLPARAKLIGQLEDIAKRHADAVEKEDFRDVYALNQRFHELQYSCCSNPRLAELIAKHARMAQPIRVVKYDDKNHMRNIVAQHFAIIDALRGTSSDEYEASIRNHLPASAKAYRTLYERRFAGRQTARG